METDPRRARYVALFAAESRTLLAGGQRALSGWLVDPDDAAPAEEVFRALHTIKGMAGSLGFDDLVARVHDAESGLAEVRSGARAADRRWLTSFEQVLDGISVACEQAVAAEASVPDAQQQRAREAVVRVDLSRLDRLLDDLGSLVTARQELERHAARDGLSPMARTAVAMSRRLDSLQDRIVHVRLAPLSEVLERIPALTRDLGRQLGKEVVVEVSGEELEVDRAILDLLPDPLMHLLRNALDHGLEAPAERRKAGKRPAGRISIRARRDRESVMVEIADDGRGIDRNAVADRARSLGMLDADSDLSDDGLLAILAKPGFSTAASLTEVSGRGVGLDAVVARLHDVGASLSLTTVAGKGTSFSLRLPTRLGIVRALVTSVGNEHYVMPLTHVSELVAWESHDARTEGGRTVVDVSGEAIPVVDLRRLLSYQGEAPPPRRPAVVFEAHGQRIALLADQVHGQVDAVIQPLERPVGLPRWISGATVLDDGRAAMLLDLASVV
ncbi:MAG TPA: chemotaxis protein CheW [Gemmatimonadales bacterium]|nr:chemotaxis protein CheW [Gemmatimonadales bacterium]